MPLPLECNFQFRPSLVQSEPINFECNGLRCTLNALGFIRASTRGRPQCINGKQMHCLNGRTDELLDRFFKQTNKLNKLI